MGEISEISGRFCDTFEKKTDLVVSVACMDAESILISTLTLQSISPLKQGLASETGLKVPPNIICFVPFNVFPNRIGWQNFAGSTRTISQLFYKNRSDWTGEYRVWMPDER